MTPAGRLSRPRAAPPVDPPWHRRVKSLRGYGFEIGLFLGSDQAFAMPTVHGIPGPYRFFFFSFDCNEPRHVHVRRERSVCKFWLEPVALAYNNGFSAKELNRVRHMIVDRLQRIREAWDEHCGE